MFPLLEIYIVSKLILILRTSSNLQLVMVMNYDLSYETFKQLAEII